MKKALWKDNFKEIRNTYKRFLSIVLMAFLGVGFFAGIKATSPDMVDTIDGYYKAQNVYDIEVLSTLGLTQKDVQALENVENVEKVYGTYETDGKLDIKNKEVIAKVLCVEEINQPIVLEGRLPQNEKECVVEPSFLNANDKKIGDTLTLEVDDTTNDEGETIAYLKEKELEIVGTVKSPMYISSDRGTTSLGTGKIHYYLYISKENVQASNVFTHIYIQVKEADKWTTSTKQYEDYIEEVKQTIETIKEERETARQEELIGIATEKVEDAETELQEEKQKAEEKLQEAEAEIAQGKQELQEAEDTIQANEKKADREFASAERQIQTAKAQIAQQEQAFIQKEQEANNQFETLEQQKQEIQTNLNTVSSGIEQITQQYNQILASLQDPLLSEEQKAVLEQTKMALEKQKQELEQHKAQCIAGITQIENGIAEGKQALENGRKQLENAKQEIDTKQRTLQATKRTTYAQIESAKQELETGRTSVQEGEETLQENRQAYEKTIAEAEEKLIDAKSNIADIEKPQWYILDRNANAGYVGFIQDTQSIAKIGQVFPAVFFVVAILISLTSMTRMVEEQRTQIGTLKALGYTKPQIASKYVVYASLASMIGGILGMIVGFILLPKVIWMMYSMMYRITDISIHFNMQYGGVGLLLISACMVGATIFSAMKELNATPATLMRPKAPKMGKRVLLEKIPFIWKHLNFSKKVTVRNLFRYKKRVLMTIIGISGCTALILTGFGLRDSISSILPSQYENIFHYDIQLNFKNGLEEEQKQAYIEKLKQKEEIEEITPIYMTSTSAVKEEKKEEVQIVVPKQEEALEKAIHVVDVKTKETISMQDGEIYITDKLAELIGAKQGDWIVLQNDKEEGVSVKIGNIVENYISHYVYMNQATYTALYAQEYTNNVLLLNHKELAEEQEEQLATEFMEDKEVASITRTTNSMRYMKDMLQLLNYVVVILIISAGLLAFVVLYNLSNVNISERIRELATIKVLGFYDQEVHAYVSRETVILTCIGIVIGLAGGFFLNSYIIGTCEINILRFPKYIQLSSYLMAALITIVFTVIVSIVTYFALKKIDMIESLKSVE